MKEKNTPDFKEKLGGTLNKLLKYGNKYSHIAKVEIQLMILLSKKNHLFKELGELVYQRMKEGRNDYTGEKTFQETMESIRGFEAEEEVLKKSIKKGINRG
ncbi:MAG: hypothetical protein PHF84_03935 [bacterium]|nr:hypothetical protein [bacterium]